MAIAASVRRRAKLETRPPVGSTVAKQRRLVAANPERDQDRERHLVEDVEEEVPLALEQAAGQERVEHAARERRGVGDAEVTEDGERRHRDQRESRNRK